MLVINNRINIFIGRGFNRDNIIVRNNIRVIAQRPRNRCFNDFNGFNNFNNFNNFGEFNNFNNFNDFNNFGEFNQLNGISRNFNNGSPSAEF